jgi:hypothetical protein
MYQTGEEESTRGTTDRENAVLHNGCLRAIEQTNATLLA